MSGPVWSYDKKGRRDFLESGTLGDFMVSLPSVTTP